MITFSNPPGVAAPASRYSHAALAHPRFVVEVEAEAFAAV